MMWDKWYPIYRRKYPDTRLDGDLARFHATCLNIRERMRECVEKAENAERPSSSLSMRWEEVAERVATNSPAWSGLGGHHPTMWAPYNGSVDKNGGGKFGSTKGHKILGMGTAGGTSVDDGFIGGGSWESGTSVHYLTKKKTLGGFVGGFRKKVKGRDDRDKEKEKEKEEKKEKEKDREQREREREKEKEEKRERERERKEARGELRIVAVADGHSHGRGHGNQPYDDFSYFDSSAKRRY